MAKTIVEQTMKRIEELKTKKADEYAKLSTELENLKSDFIAQNLQMESDRSEGNYENYKESENKVKELEFKIESLKKYLEDIEMKPMTSDKECAETEKKLDDYSKKIVDEYNDGVRKKLKEVQAYIEEGIGILEEVYNVCYGYQAEVSKDIEKSFLGEALNIHAVNPYGELFLKDARHMVDTILRQ